MPTFVHFNITAEDPQQIEDFYHRLFDWKIESLPGQNIPYRFISTKNLRGEVGIGGGISKGKPEIINYVGVSSIERTLNMVTALGGTVILEKQEIPGFGFVAAFLDPEQNTIGLFEEQTQSNKL